MINLKTIIEPITKIGEIIDDATLSNEEKANIKLELGYLQEQIHESARNREIEINKSQYASWLAKNISSLLAIMIVLAACVSWFFPTVIGAAAGAYISSALMLVLAYFFGSEVGKFVPTDTAELRHQRKMLKIENKK